MKLNSPKILTYTNQEIKQPERYVVIINIENEKSNGKTEIIKGVWMSTEMPTINAYLIDKKGNSHFGRIQDTNPVLESVYLQNPDKYSKAYPVEDAPIEDKRVKSLLIELDKETVF